MTLRQELEVLEEWIVECTTDRGMAVSIACCDPTTLKAMASLCRRAVEEADRLAVGNLEAQHRAAVEGTRLRARLTQAEGLLREAIDHLEYCGYGDSWERECAYADELPQRLAAFKAHDDKDRASGAESEASDEAL